MRVLIGYYVPNMVYLFKFNVLTGFGADIVSTTTPALVVLLGMVF